MVDVFDALNQVNQHIQGDEVNIIEAEKAIVMETNKRHDSAGKIENVSGIEDNSVPRELKQVIVMQLDELTVCQQILPPQRVTSSIGKTAICSHLALRYQTSMMNVLHHSQVQQKLFIATTLKLVSSNHSIRFYC